MAADSEEIESLLKLAEDCHQRGSLDEAFAYFGRILEIDPRQADALYGIGTVQLQQGKYADAVDALKNAAQICPDVPEFFANYGMALEAIGEKEEAVAAYGKAIHLAPNDVGILSRLGKRLVDLGYHRQIYQLLESADTSIIDVALLKADAERALGNWAGATATLKAIAKQQPENKHSWRSLSYAAAKIRDFPTALSAYKKSIEPNSASDSELLALADLQLQARDSESVESAESTVKEALKINPKNSEANLLRAKCARISGDNEQLRLSLDKALSENPFSGEAWQLKLENEADNSIEESASKCLSLMTERSNEVSSRDYTLALLACGRAFEKLAHYDLAFECIEKGNAAHKAKLEENNFSYDPQETESGFARFLEIFESAPAKSKSLGPSPIFILGMPRSGTTLIERILGEHEAVSFLGENEAMEYIAAQFYWDIEQHNQTLPSALDANYWATLQEEYWARSNCAPGLVTDKMPHNFRHTGLIVSIFPNSPVIYVKRDLRDVCLSIYSRMFPDGHRYACDLQWIAHYAQQAALLMDAWQKRFPERVLMVDYEALIANPQVVCSEVYEFCELQWNPQFLNFHEKNHASFTFSELQVRKPLNTEGIGRWRQYEAQLFDRAPSLRIYGEN